ncbi:hypothetical protein [Breoghania sp.]|uniref:SLOG cluster 4 domain-containing protein n=1 Tax=Breoghania sp. TaxID=2065378 RepID=UPI00262FB111|nr:hypothetical protein [Breoghania sp.]MDJ0933028.1 hypothetical protein [Breoghania sp.]
MGTRIYGIDGTQVYSESGVLDPWAWTRKPGVAKPETAVDASALEALRVVGASGLARRVPVGVIGPREATSEQLEAAERVGTELGKLGLTVICGGKSGVMEAVSRRCLGAGGL